MIANCPVTVDDIKLAEKIYGTDIATLKGKTVRKQPKPVVIDCVSVPKDILETHQEVTITADIMLINTVTDNKANHSECQVQHADQVQKVHRMVGYPSI